MADHFVQQVVDALATKLTGLDTTGANVFKEDDFPREESKLPCLNIFCSGFSRSRRGTRNGRPEVENVITLTVQGVAREKNSAREKAWVIAKEVEARWLATTEDERFTVNGVSLVHRAELTGVDVEVDTSGNRPYGVADQTFTVVVRSIEGKPDLSQ